MTRKILAVLMCSALSLTPLSAHAGMDPAGAEAAKAAVKDMIDTHVNQIKANYPDITLKWSGDYTVETKDTYYTVTTPHMVAEVIKEIPRPGKTEAGVLLVDAGKARINVIPGSAPHQWRMAIAIASPIRYSIVGLPGCLTETKSKSPDKKQAAGCSGEPKTLSVDIGFKHTKGQTLWDDQNHVDLKADFLLENITATYNQKPLPFSIASISGQKMSTEKSPGVFDGQIAGSLKNFVLDLTGENCPKPCTTSVKATIGDIVETASYTGYDIKKANAFQTKMAEMDKAGFDPEKGVSPESFAALWKWIMTDGFDTIDGAKGEFAIRDTSVTFTDKPGDPPETVGIKELKYFGGIDSWKSEKANIQFGQSLAGLVLPSAAHDSPAFRVLEPYIPTQGSMKFEVKNLPHRKLMEQIGTMTQNALASTSAPTCPAGTPPDKCPTTNGASMQQAQLLGMQAMMTLPQLLAQAGTVVTTHVDTDAPKGSVLVDGDFTARADAVYSGVGKMKVILGGVDAFLADMQTAMKDPTLPPRDAETIKSIVAGLTGIQMMGQQGKDAKGRDARTYDLAVDEKGAVKLNGADMNALVGGAPQTGGATTPPAGGTGTVEMDIPMVNGASTPTVPSVDTPTKPAPFQDPLAKGSNGSKPKGTP